MNPAWPVALACCAVSAVANESSYQCSNGIVQPGDATYTVKEKCGEPNSVEAISGGGADLVEQNWYYGGGTRLPYVLRIKGGELTQIVRLNR